MSSVEKDQSAAEVTTSAGSHTCRPFYLNILLLNKAEIVAQKVAAKAGTGLFGRAAGFAANRLVSDEKIMDNLAEKLIGGVQRATSELGITADMEVKFQQGPFVVIRVQVTEVDTLQLILSSKGPEFASNFTTLMTAVEALGIKDSVNQKVEEKVNSSISEGMMRKFKEMIPHKMAEQGVNVECDAVSAEEQAEVFFKLLSDLKGESK